MRPDSECYVRPKCETILSIYSTAMQNSRVGAPRWSRPPMREFRVGDTNMLVSNNAKICVTPNANAKICMSLTPTPNASRWNIGGVGTPTQGAGVGHVHFMFFCVDFTNPLGKQGPQCKILVLAIPSFFLSISFPLGPVFQWNMGFRKKVYKSIY